MKDFKEYLSEAAKPEKKENRGIAYQTGIYDNMRSELDIIQAGNSKKQPKGSMNCFTVSTTKSGEATAGDLRVVFKSGSTPLNIEVKFEQAQGPQIAIKSENGVWKMAEGAPFADKITIQSETDENGVKIPVFYANAGSDVAVKSLAAILNATIRPLIAKKVKRFDILADAHMAYQEGCGRYFTNSSGVAPITKTFSIPVIAIAEVTKPIRKSITAEIEKFGKETGATDTVPINAKQYWKAFDYILKSQGDVMIQFSGKGLYRVSNTALPDFCGSEIAGVPTIAQAAASIKDKDIGEIEWRSKPTGFGNSLNTVIEHGKWLLLKANSIPKDWMMGASFAKTYPVSVNDLEAAGKFSMVSVDGTKVYKLGGDYVIGDGDFIGYITSITNTPKLVKIGGKNHILVKVSFAHSHSRVDMPFVLRVEPKLNQKLADSTFNLEDPADVKRFMRDVKPCNYSAPRKITEAISVIKGLTNVQFIHDGKPLTDNYYKTADGIHKAFVSSWLEDGLLPDDRTKKFTGKRTVMINGKPQNSVRYESFSGMMTPENAVLATMIGSVVTAPLTGAAIIALENKAKKFLSGLASMLKKLSVQKKRDINEFEKWFNTQMNNANKPSVYESFMAQPLSESVTIAEMQRGIAYLIVLIKQHEKLAYEAKKAKDMVGYNKHRDHVKEFSQDITTAKNMILQAMRSSNPV